LGIRTSRAIVRILIVRTYAGSNGRRLGMSTTKKKSAMIVVAIALVAALAVTGTLMTYAFRDKSPISVKTMGTKGLEIYLTQYRDVDGDGTFEGAVALGTATTSTDDDGKLIYVYSNPLYITTAACRLPYYSEYRVPVAESVVSEAKIVPGDFVPLPTSIYLAGDENINAFVRIKVKSTVTFGAIDANGDDNTSDLEKEKYYSKVAAALFTLRDHIGIQNGIKNTSDRNKWHFEFDLAPEEKIALNSIVGKNDSNEANMETPESITLTGYIYYAKNNSSSGNMELVPLKPSNTMLYDTSIDFLNGVVFPAYQTRDDSDFNFLDEWAKYRTWYEGEDYLGRIIENVDPPNTDAFFDKVEDSTGEVYIDSDKYPLTGATIAIELMGQTIQTQSADSVTLNDDVKGKFEKAMKPKAETTSNEPAEGSANENDGGE
jgi:hypothetical protein